jgi:hypothetical protein
MKRLALALSVGLALAHSLRVAAAGGDLGLSFLTAAKCGASTDNQCLVAGPKEWTADERAIIEDALLRLTTRELFRGLLVAAQENGYKGLRRYSTATKRDPNFGRVAMFSPGFVFYGSKDIGITDAYFQTKGVTDPISGYRYGDLILVHELVHAFDDGRYSREGAFTSVSGWVLRNERWSYTYPVDIPAYHRVFAQTLTSYARGRHEDAWVEDRTFATTMRFPLPTIQSLVSPSESFADILAHLIIDEQATTYLKPQIVDWFEAEMFPFLREKARRFRAADLTQPPARD